MSVSIDKLRIVNYPHPTLLKAAEPVGEVDGQVTAVAQRMIELMHEARGIGLAAPQVALPWRLFVANPTNTPGDDRVFINPVLTDPSRETAEMEEGCLSLPEINARVRRPLGITITATDLEGNAFSLTSDAMPARVWQHEYDHLDGILILDKMNRLDKLANRRAIKQLELAG